MELSDQQFGRHVAALILENTGFIKRFRNILDPRYFAGSPDLHWLMVECIKFYDAFKLAPTTEVMEMTARSAKFPSNVSAVKIDAILESVRQNSSPTGAVYEYVCVELERYIKKNAVILAGKETADFLDTDPDRFVSAIEKAGRIKVESETFLVVPDDLDVIFDFFNQDNLQDISITTGVPALDRMIGGGLRPGELGVFMAATGIGKSQALVHAGAAALKAGKTVVHFSLENSEEQTLGRYYSNLLGKPIEYIVGAGSDEEKENVREKLNSLLQRIDSDGKIYVKWLPPSSTDSDRLDALLEKLEADGVEIGLIIVDYGDLMRSTSRFDKKYDEQTEVFVELRDLAMRHQAPLWTGTQAGRAALTTKHVKLNMIAESMGKAHKSDVVIAMSQTDDESKLSPPEMRLQIVKMRRDRAYGRVRVQAEFEMSRLTEIEGDYDDDDSFGD